MKTYTRKEEGELQYLVGDILKLRDSGIGSFIIVEDDDFYNLIDIDTFKTIYSTSVTVCEIRKTYKATNYKLSIGG